MVEGHSDGGNGCARGAGCLAAGYKSRGGGGGFGGGGLGLAAAADNGDVGTREVDLSSLERVPAEGEQGMTGDVVGDLDLLGDSVAASNGGEARSESSVVDALATAAVVGLKGVAG